MYSLMYSFGALPPGKVPDEAENLRGNRSNVIENVSLNHGESVFDCQKPFDPILQQITRGYRFHPALGSLSKVAFQ